MKIFAHTNLKGGTGKTTSVVSIADALANRGKMVLVVDLDPQATLSRWLSAPSDSMTTLLSGKGSPTVSTVSPNIHAITSNRSLQDVESVRAAKLSQRLERLWGAVEDKFDFALVDPPPSASSFVLAAVAAADMMVVPVEAAPGAVQGMTDTLQVLRRFASGIPTAMHACRVDRRTSLHSDVPDKLLDEYGSIHSGGIACESFIREAVDMQRAQGGAKLPSAYDSSMSAVRDYQRLTQEILAATGEAAYKPTSSASCAADDENPINAIA